MSASFPTPESLCAQSDPDFWNPPDGTSSQTTRQYYRIARGICTRCGMREACLKFALDNDIHFGMWGGLSPRERMRVKARQ